MKDDEVIEGEQDSEKFLYHKVYNHLFHTTKWRFETYIPDTDWILTDVDDTLKGNSYHS